MSKILVIAYGNPLRCDDGLAWHAADELSKESLDKELLDLEILRTHQLTPELAKTVSLSQAVIFIDAAREGAPGEIVSHVIYSQPASFDASHHFTPSKVMALAEELYGRRPHAVCISMVGDNFEHGEVLSQAVVKALPKLVLAVKNLAQTRPFSGQTDCVDGRRGKALKIVG